jgi:hypothetical protein
VDEPLKPVLDPGAAAPAPLLPPDERERLGQRLQHALAGFVDDPRRAVEEAAAILDDAGERITASLAEQRRTLRESGSGAASGSADDTEELRVALRKYRETTERLLRI